MNIKDTENFNCREAEFLYLLSDGFQLDYIMSLFKVKYGYQDNELETFSKYLLKKIHKQFGIYGIERFATLNKELIRNEFNKCLKSSYENLKEYILKLEPNEKKFLRFILDNMKLKTTNYPIIKAFIGAFKACTGLSIQEETIKKLLKIGLIPRYVKIDNDIYQWLEIHEKIWLFIRQLIKDTEFEHTEKIDGITINPLFDLIIKVTNPRKIIIRRDIIDELIQINFPDIKIKESFIPFYYMDERYFYVCPYTVKYLEEKIFEHKTEEVKSLLKDIGLAFETAKNKDHIFFTDEEGLDIILTPWFFFHEKSAYIDTLPEHRILDDTKGKLLILNGQKVNRNIIKSIIKSGVDDIGILYKNENNNWELTVISTKKGFIEKIHKTLSTLNIKYNDATCTNISEAFPLKDTEILKFILEHYSYDEIEILVDPILTTKDDSLILEEKLQRAIKKVGLINIAHLFGHPSIKYCHEHLHGQYLS